MSHAPILIIEDEPKIAQILVDFFQLEGFHCDVVNDGNEAIPAIHQYQPAAVILDLMLPNKDGLTICKEVREFSNVPILMLTARVDEIDRLIGLSIGADDYVCKPFSAREVVARIQAILRRSHPPTTAPKSLLQYKGICIDKEKHQCHVEGQDIDLTPVEFRLLSQLVENPGIVHSRNKLMDSGYDDGRIVSERTIDSHMKNLRSKLSAVISNFNYLHAVYGVGYKLD